MSKRNFMLGLESAEGVPIGTGLPVNNPEGETQTLELVEVPTDELTGVILENQEIAAIYAEEQAESAAMDHLEVAVEQYQDLIEAKACTPATLFLMQQVTAPHLKTLGLTAQTVSIETLDKDSDITQLHQVALEGLLTNLGQKVVLGNKHMWNAIADRFHTQNGQVVKYEEKLKAAKKEYDAKKSSMGGKDMIVSLTELWYHFATDKGQAKDLIPVMKKDMEMSKYVLGDYPVVVLSAVKKAIGILKACKGDSVAEFGKLFDQMGNLQTPGELFNKKFLGGRPYLSVTGLALEEGSERPVRQLDGKSYPKLAAVATSSHVGVNWSGMHTATKVIHRAGGAMPGPLGLAAVAAEMILSEKIPYTTAEIGTLIDFGNQYLGLVKTYLKRLNEMTSTVDQAAKEVARLEEKANTGEVKALMKQVEQVIENLKFGLFYPGDDEAARAIKCAKYNHYLALRMIHNAT